MSFPFAPDQGGAQMMVYDVDGDNDNDNDVVTALNAHGYGLSWYEQISGDNGEITFRNNEIMSSVSKENSY